MITTETATYMFRDGAIFITTTSAGACGCGCGRSSYLFISRNGRTVSALCDATPTRATRAGDPGGKRVMVASSEKIDADDVNAQLAFEALV